MFKRPWTLRGGELQLLITVLLFFGFGYVLVVMTATASTFQPTVRTVVDVLWPSVLPFLLFLALSLTMGWIVPQADQIIFERPHD